MASVRPCGYGNWAYCDGRCWTCQSRAGVATISTQQRDFGLNATAQYTTVVPPDKDINVPSKEET